MSLSWGPLSPPGSESLRESADTGFDNDLPDFLSTKDAEDERGRNQIALGCSSISSYLWVSFPVVLILIDITQQPFNLSWAALISLHLSHF